MTAACADCIDPALMAGAPANLQYRRVDVANERNGFLDLQGATEMLVGDGMRPDVEYATDADDVRWVEQNQAALHLIEAAVWAPEFQLPLFDLDQNWAPYRQAMRLKTVRARVHTAAGRWHDAAQDLIETFEIGQRPSTASQCTPKPRCRSVLTQLIAKHPNPFDAADQIQASGRLIAATWPTSLPSCRPITRRR